MSSRETIIDLLLTELDTFTDEELQDVTIAVTVDGTTYAINSWEFETLEELIEAIENHKDALRVFDANGSS